MYKSQSGKRDDIDESLKQIDGASGATTTDLTNILNETFLPSMSGFAPLPSDFLCSFN